MSERERGAGQGGDQPWPRGVSVTRRARALALLAASGLLLLAALLLAPAALAQAATSIEPAEPNNPRVTETLAVPTFTPPDLPTATPTNATGATATVAATGTATVAGGTPTVTGTASATTTVTPATQTATPTQSANNTNSGDPGQGGGQGGGAQPTKVVFSQPTVSGGSSGPGNLTPGSVGVNGVLLATIFSCLVGVMGVILAAIAFTALNQRGYGPFLRALWYGKRSPKAKAGQAAHSVASPTAGDVGRARRAPDEQPRGAKGGFEKSPAKSATASVAGSSRRSAPRATPASRGPSRR